MSKPVLVAKVNAPDVARRAYAVPARSIESPEKIEMPAEAGTVVVPDRMAPAVPVPGVIATVMFPAKLVAVLPNASCAATRTDGLMLAPAVVVVGCTVKASRVAVPGVMLKALLVSGANAPAVAVRR
jgi:hypothetical protein